MARQSLNVSVVPRLDQVDLLRGFSILGVILLHISIFAHAGKISLGQHMPLWLSYLVFSNGGNGVSAFFVVSGFLITLTSIRRFGSLDEMRVGRFYRIRFARIAPPLFLLLVVLSAMHLAKVPRFRINPQVCSLPRPVFSALTFHLNWLEAVHGWLPPCWTVLWSLSIEEMFYLAFPLACAGLYRKCLTKVLFFAVLAGLIVVGPFARTVLTSNEIWQGQSYLSNMDGIAMGCLCAIFTDWCSSPSKLTSTRWPLAMQLLGAMTMLLVAVWPWPTTILGWHFKHAMAKSGTDVTVLIFGTALFVCGSAMRGNRGNALLEPIRWFGRYSYEVYLSHEFAVIAVLTTFFKVRRGPIVLWVALVVLSTAVLGWGFAQYFSEPMNRKLRGRSAPTELHAESQRCGC